MSRDPLGAHRAVPSGHEQPREEKHKNMGLQAALLLIVWWAGGLQATPPAEPLPMELAAIPRVDAPADPGGWSLVLITRGGMGGGAENNVTLTSAGSVTCSNPNSKCPATLDRRAVAALSRQVELSWAAFTAPAAHLCSDCVRTFLLITRRDPSGQPHIRAASWDVTTQAQLPPDIVRLAGSAIASVEAR